MSTTQPSNNQLSDSQASDSQASNSRPVQAPADQTQGEQTQGEQPQEVSAQQRWRLMLGTGQDGSRESQDGGLLTPEQRAMDRALAALYDSGGDGQLAGSRARKGRGGLGALGGHLAR